MSRARGDLPRLPKRPHGFYQLERKRAPVPLAGREAPAHLSYVELGSGEPLLLVHGLMTNAYSFRYVIYALAEHYRVIVPDLPGAGMSDAPRDLAMTPESIADVLASFMIGVHAPRAYVVGNSLGGYLSTWLALRHPDRVERLMIMHAPGFPELRLYALRFALSVPGSRALFRLLVRRPEQFVAKNVHYNDRTLMSQEEAKEYGAIFSDPDRTDAFVRVLHDAMSPFAMRRLKRTLEQRRDRHEPFAPVRLLWSRQDALVPPENGPRYARLFPSADLVWVDDSSHFLQVDSPDRTVDEILRFGDRPRGAQRRPTT